MWKKTPKKIESWLIFFWISSSSVVYKIFGFRFSAKELELGTGSDQSTIINDNNNNRNHHMIKQIEFQATASSRFKLSISLGKRHNTPL